MTLPPQHNAPALLLSVLAIAGILIGNALSLSPAALVPVAVCIGVLSLIVVVYLFFRKQPTAHISIAAAAICILAGIGKISLDRERSAHPPSTLLRHEIVVVGMIADIPTVVGNQTRFPLNACCAVDRGTQQALEATMLVTLKRSHADTLACEPAYGMTVALAGMLSPLSEERNPGEFSPRQYYEANGISMTYYVRSHTALVVLDSTGGAWWMRSIVAPVRRYLLASIDREVGGEEGEFLKGLLIGVRSGMSPAIRQAFMNAGVTHVLAVSGSNVAVVVAFFFLLFELVRLPKWLRLFATTGALLFYMVLTGSQPPVVRATIMALVFMLGSILQKRSNAYNALGLSALIILAIDARQIFDVGFQLSYGAVLSIVYLYPLANDWISRIGDSSLIRRLIEWLLRLCAVSVVATLGTLPLTAIYFGRVSIIGVLANLLVIPAVGLSVFLGCAAALLGCVSSWIAGVYQAANWLILRLTLLVIDLCGNSSFAYVDTTRFRFIDSLPFYAALALAFHFSGRSARKPLLIILLLALNIAVYFPRPAALAPAGKRLRVSIIDVGEGDAALAEFPGGWTMLVDAGPRSLSYDAGERIVVPFLKRRGISAIDLFVASHPHSDHIGGLPAVLRNFTVRRIIDGGPAFRSVLFAECKGCRELQDSLCRSMGAGMVLPSPPGVRLYALSPPRAHTALNESDAVTKADNTCIVIKLQYGEISCLFTGDAEKTEEQQLLADYGDFLQSMLLKVGHHGSNTSSTPAFLAAVQPSVAVISVGRNNKFRHPSPAVVRRLEEMHLALARTDEDGAVVFESDGSSLSRIDWH